VSESREVKEHLIGIGKGWERVGLTTVMSRCQIDRVKNISRHCRELKGNLGK
jgi:hypothetical protein